nr:hypothetical protein [Tanacetum cinerariifolium]
MHKAFPLLVRKFPLPEGTSHCLKMNATVRRIKMPLPEVCTAVEEKKKKLPVKDRWKILRANAGPASRPPPPASRRRRLPLPEIFPANPKLTPSHPIYPIHQPPIPCTATSDTTANTIAAALPPCTTLGRPQPTPPPSLPSSAAATSAGTITPTTMASTKRHRAQHHATTTKPPPSSSSAAAPAATTAATAAAFPAAAVAVAGFGWQFGHHRHASSRGCPSPNHHRGGGRTTVQLPQPHLVVSGLWW